MTDSGSVTSQTPPPATSQASEAGVWLDRALGACAAILLFCLMALTTADVIGRYVFNSPLRGAFELTELAAVDADLCRTATRLAGG